MAVAMLPEPMMLIVVMMMLLRGLRAGTEVRHPSPRLSITGGVPHCIPEERLNLAEDSSSPDTLAHERLVDRAETEAVLRIVGRLRE
jgi:hypothetical protein